MKTYVLTVSRVFPTTHKRRGEKTHFPDGILNVLSSTNPEWRKYINEQYLSARKLHTIRSNKTGTAYNRWSKKIKEIQEGKAILSIRYWSGKPYNSKQVEICQLDKDSGIGVQKIWFYQSLLRFPRIQTESDSVLAVKPSFLANNDGLTIEDFESWFKGYDLSKEMAIIHFTSFRY